MQRLLSLVLLIALIAIAGCTSTPVTPQPTIPTLVPEIPSPTGAATATSAAIPTLAVDTATPVPATATTAPTVKPTAVSTLPPTSGSVVYRSANLGIQFSYLAANQGMVIKTQESGDKVYVYAANTSPTSGQWVQVFSKPSGQSLVDAINTQVLGGYSLQDCITKLVPNPNGGAPTPLTYSFAQITLPIGANDTQETIQAKAMKCPQPYAAIGGLAYFVADSQYPDRFAFFSIGQYAIMAANNLPWQNTLQFLPAGATGGIPPSYLDDRSTPQSLLQSLVNAINRREYVRAYSYWEPGAPGLAPFNQFAAGYADTQSVQLALGPVRGGAAAGNLYASVPVVLTVQTQSGGTQTFAGCYVTHQPQPANFGAPPFAPMAIQSAQVKQVANGGNPATLLSSACTSADYQQGQPLPAPIPFNLNDIGANRFFDNRTGPAELLGSLFNAVNRREYVRAYSYWEANAQGLKPYDQFAAGYANTASVQVRIGIVSPDAGAGQIYYAVPVTLIAQTTNGETQTFVGCYTLHISNPGIQGTPPFAPLGIKSAKVQQVANTADTTARMQTACQ